MRKQMTIQKQVILVFGFLMIAINMYSIGNAEPPFGIQAVPRDAFPVFDNPHMISPEEAEKRGIIFPKDAVIGVALGSEAKAYPVAVMGVHELGNDTISGIPIAIGW